MERSVVRASPVAFTARYDGLVGHDWLGLEGRGALVAGAGGIGEAVALALARAGARVAVTDVSEPRLAELARSAAAESLVIRTVAFDLTSASAARQAVGDAAALLGGAGCPRGHDRAGARRPARHRGRPGRPGPVLCSAQSAFVTGHVMYVDGGRTLV